MGLDQPEVFKTSVGAVAAGTTLVAQWRAAATEQRDGEAAAAAAEVPAAEAPAPPPRVAGLFLNDMLDLGQYEYVSGGDDDKDSDDDDDSE